MFSSDKPIKGKNFDLLNRTNFSRRLAEAILSYTDTDNFTIGLCGKWGTGKTSVLNMVLEEISNLASSLETDEKPIIVSFNPWNYSDQAQLTTQFFKTIMSSLGKKDNNKNLQKLGDALQHYADILDYATYIPVAGEGIKLGKFLISGTGKMVSKKAKANDSLESRKDAVWQVLESQKQKLIVVIDDIDRLTNSQIRLIFQLVNSLAGFPNMIYLLSFDKDVVVRALSEEQNCNGEEYLEKIIQVPFEIPEANKSLIENVFCQKISDIILPGIEQDDTFDIGYWKHIFSGCISPFINTMRDVNRVVNTFKFKFGLMRDEVNCVDLLAITTLQICAADIYNWIFKNSSNLTGSVMSANGISGAEQKDNAAKYAKEFESVYSRDPKLMVSVIQSLFPKFSWNTGGHTRDYDDELALRHNHRIASKDRIHRYFNLSLEDIVIDKRQMLQTLCNYTKEQLKKYFQTLVKSDALYNYLHELIAYIPDMPQERVFMFIELLTELRMLEESKQRRGFLTPTIEGKAAACVHQLFKSNDKNENANNLIRWIENAVPTTLPYICEIMEYLERGYGKNGDFPSSDGQFVGESDLETIEKRLLEKLKELSKQACLFDYEGVEEICYIWNLLEKETFEEYTKSLIEKDENIPKYLNIISLYWHSSDGTDGWHFSGDSFGEIISKEDAFVRISRLKNSKKFSELAHKFKQSTIAFSLWYQREEKAQTHITREEIDALVPTWEYVEDTGFASQ